MNNINLINLPFPVLTENGGDFIDSRFEVKCSTELADEGNILKLNFEYELKCPFYEKLLIENKIVLIANVNQKSYRVSFPLRRKTLEIKMNELLPNYNLEVRTMIMAREDFEFQYDDSMNIVFKYFDDNFKVKYGQILGYGSSIEIELPTSNKVGSIFTISKFKDVKDIDSGRPYDVSFEYETIDIKVQPKIHKNFSDAIESNFSMSKIFYSTVVYPAVQLAIITIMTDYESVKEHKWAIAIENKIKKEIQTELPKDGNINTQDLLTYTHIVLGQLITDAFESLKGGNE